uniref:CSON001119 protein n=1 Tax=Culicoides sonorensis TaxID=179676 RepID=A0A336MG02_CULSO
MVVINPEKFEPNFGDLGMQDALQRLHNEILEVLTVYEEKVEEEPFIQRFHDFYKYNGSLHWISVLGSLFCFILLLISCDFIAALILFIVLSATVYLQFRENYLKKTELYRKVRTVLKELEVAIDMSHEWTSDNFPHIYSPLSPCVSLQWCYRDGKVVNLPWALLVKGDYIILRPGQTAPEDCTELNGKHKFLAGETYRLLTQVDPPNKPTARVPLGDLILVLTKTPFVEILKTALENFLNRPPTIFDQQRDLLITRSIQQWGFIFILIITILTGILRYTGVYLQGKTQFNWTEVFIVNPVAATLPLLPLILPIVWVAISLWGMARLQTILSVAPILNNNEQQKSFQEDLESPSDLECDHIVLPRRDVFYHWLNLIMGDSALLGRSTNVVQVLGTVTALCCVDKKGILSWPNPTAEKVFFLRNPSDTSSNKSSSSSLSSEDDIDMPQHDGPVTEVLDLTHDQHSPFKLEFDDHEWKAHINSLKPLGLAILVNTCCPLTQKHYASFCGHISAQFDKNLVPVTNRYSFVESRIISFSHGRCLCELARQIGFSTQARSIFQLSGQISSYRHLQPEIVRREMRLAKSLHITKVKVPFPHSMSVVVKESPSGSLQLLTQGTADIVLDCCDDYWNGKDLKPLSREDRKRALDFYQRNALTAYCTAFAYKPLRHGIFEKMGLESGWNCHISLLSDDKSNIPSPKNSVNFDFDTEPTENHRLLVPSTLESTKTLSSSAPCAISQQPISSHNSKDSLAMDHGTSHRASKDSAMEENCRSLSCLSEITEQSAPINFDMSNRAKLPRGIENIRPHLENVDNVPLLVSLFTDCSAEATREMLSIMQQYGEIVVCLGSSASNANCEIFLTADCSIAIEPLYPQVCQDYPAYTEANIYNNSTRIKDTKRSKFFSSVMERPVTISPIYLSRVLNSIPCSISMLRDDPLSIVTLIELSRRFSVGFWNCIQFWASCACSFTLLNTIIACLTLPPIITPIIILYFMCIAVPLLSVSLVRVEPDPLILNRATGKKQTSLNSNLFIFVIWCYGCKFLPMIVTMILAYCSFVSHPVIVINNDDENYEKDLQLARHFIVFGIILHLIAISSTFVHRDYSIWEKNPFRNVCWLSSCALLFGFHIVVILLQFVLNDYVIHEVERIWPICLFLLISVTVTYAIAEFIKWEEIK